MNGDKPLGLILVLSIAALDGVLSPSSAQEKPVAITDFQQPEYYGVPDSPAFALLPSKPDEVVDIVTPSDFQSNVAFWHDGTRLLAGFAFDTRPFYKAGGSIQQYRKSPIRPALFRSVLSAGTATATEGSQDVTLAAGLRVPLIDRGDPRMDKAYQERLASLNNLLIASQGQPSFDVPMDSLVARRQRASEGLRSVREEFQRKHWNATKVDLGLAASTRIQGAELHPDSLSGDRAGAWLAASVPLSRFAQLTASGKASWANADSIGFEFRRESVGLRLRAFASSRFAFSVEAAKVWAQYKQRADSNQDWNHFGAIAEWYVPNLKGWLGFGYGDTASQREEADPTFALRYSFSKNQVLKP